MIDVLTSDKGGIHGAGIRTALKLDDDLVGLLKPRAGTRHYRTIRAGIGTASVTGRHPAPKTTSHSFGFRPGIDLDKLGQLADELEAEAFAAKTDDSARGKRLVHAHRADSALHHRAGCGGTLVSRAPKALAALSRGRNGLRAMDDRRHPVRRAPRQSGFDRLVLKVVNYWSRCETLTIAQAVDIDDRPCPRRQFRDCCDKDAATAADQKITTARSEAIIFHERPVVCPNLE